MAGNNNSGAKLKLNDEIIQKIVDLIQKGNFAKVVCQSLGICEATFYNWKNQGIKDKEENKQTIFFEFLKSIEQAEAEAEIKMLEKAVDLTNCSSKDAQWWLERTKSERFGQSHKIDIETDKFDKLIDAFRGIK